MSSLALIEGLFFLFVDNITGVVSYFGEPGELESLRGFSLNVVTPWIMICSLMERILEEVIFEVDRSPSNMSSSTIGLSDLADDPYFSRVRFWDEEIGSDTLETDWSET